MASFYPDLYQNALRLLIIARENAGLSPAERLAQPKGLVTSYESGDRLLDPAEFITISRAIGVNPYELLCAAEKSESQCRS